MERCTISGRYISSLVFGEGIYNCINTTKDEGVCYTVWRGMLKRCYSIKHISLNMSYNGCSVSDSWKTYSEFREWFFRNHILDGELDKDLFGDGKVYSENNCCFLPKRINLNLPKLNTTSPTKTGVVLRDYGKYTSQISGINGRVKHLGTFLREEDAFEAYCLEKDKNIRELAVEYKSILKENVYFKLLEFKTKDYIHKFTPISDMEELS